MNAKYGPQPLDLLQTALRTFFHELQVKPGEHYRQFVVRFEALEEQNHGYFPANEGGQQGCKAGPEAWKLTETVSYGHWKKECPMKRSSA